MGARPNDTDMGLCNSLWEPILAKRTQVGVPWFGLGIESELENVGLGKMTGRRRPVAGNGAAFTELICLRVEPLGTTFTGNRRWCALNGPRNRLRNERTGIGGNCLLQQPGAWLGDSHQD